MYIFGSTSTHAHTSPRGAKQDAKTIARESYARTRTHKGERQACTGRLERAKEGWGGGGGERAPPWELSEGECCSQGCIRYITTTIAPLLCLYYDLL